MDERKIDEILEALWVCHERDRLGIEALQRFCHVAVEQEDLSTLERESYITLDGERILFSLKGKKRATMILRRHRLAERLITDVLNIPLHEAEKAACEFEHFLASEVTDSICTLLGHPRECPHGAPIPEGDCCREAKESLGSAVVPLTKLETGHSAMIAYVSTVSHPRLHKLMSFGLVPGVQIKIHQKTPSYVISCEQTELALEEDVARDIHVWRNGADA